MIKLGGSLADSSELQPWLDVLASFGGGNVVIVPGGGPFADQVRRAQELWGFSDEIGHRMALLAMEQYAVMLAGLRRDLRPVESVQEMEEVLSTAGLPVWLPTRMTMGNPDIPASWEMTSDSLAAWLAHKLGASMLVLVKSIQPMQSVVPASELSECGLVDAMFPVIAARGSYEIRVMGKSQFDIMKQMLLTGMMAGTIVQTAKKGRGARR